ncbi:MAG: glycosyltransferase family 2 protein [Candidatus Omnitrophica bacterium]|nr:glycosyltransferase family 2 protein [Candidatus Omnitrophota bacterium]
MDRCDIIIPVWNEHEMTRECVESIQKHAGYPFRLIIIDNGSETATKSYLDSLCAKKETEITLVRNPENLGFVKAVNQGLKLSDSRYACLMNNDTIATAGWLKEMVDVAGSDPAIGLVNPSSNTSGQFPPDGKGIEEYAVSLKEFRGQTQELYNCRGFCMLLKREVVEKVGLLDEEYGIGYFEETDYCRRAHGAGFSAVRAKAAYVYHRERATFDKLKDTKALFKANENIFFKKWGRPVKLAYLADSVSYADKINDIAVDAARHGHRISVFLKKGLSWPVKIDHFDIRRCDINAALFGLISACKILKNRKKKPLEVIVTDNRALGRFLAAIKPLHGSDVLVGADKEMVFDLLEKRSRSF